MKIAELKQPYRRMAEYLGDENNTISHSLSNYFFRHETGVDFWKNVYHLDYPPITEEIKKLFPPDFDFSGEEVKNKPIMQMLDTETQKTIYTKLAKDGKFDELPDTCEFSMPVTLEVFDKETKMLGEKWILGKFRGRYISTGFNVYLGVKLPTPKIDFSEFKSGDVVEVELSNEEKRIGWFDYTNNNHLYIRILQRKGNQICNGGSCAGTKIINKEKIKSITKIK